MQRNWMAKGVRDSIKKAKDGDKHIKAANRASSEKQAAKAKQTDRRIERLEVVEEPRKEWELRMEIAAAPACRRRRRHPARGGRRRGGSRSARWTCRSTGATGWRSPARTAPASPPCSRRCSAACRSTRAPRRSAPRCGSARSTRPAASSSAPSSCSTPFGAEVPDWPTSEVRTLLAKFGLTAEHVLRPAETLSPGERTRAALALLQARGVNLLVLDEPTNHLDLPAIEQLEEALAGYDGTCCWSPTTAGCSRRCETTRRLEVRGRTGSSRPERWADGSAR